MISMTDLTLSLTEKWAFLVVDGSCWSLLVVEYDQGFHYGRSCRNTGAAAILESSSSLRTIPSLSCFCNHEFSRNTANDRLSTVVSVLIPMFFISVAYAQHALKLLNLNEEWKEYMLFFFFVLFSILMKKKIIRTRVFSWKCNIKFINVMYFFFHCGWTHVQDCNTTLQVSNLITTQWEFLFKKDKICISF